MLLRAARKGCILHTHVRDRVSKTGSWEDMQELGSHNVCGIVSVSANGKGGKGQD